MGVVLLWDREWRELVEKREKRCEFPIPWVQATCD